MARRRSRPKHIPHRTCVVCRTVRPKRELIRIVRTSQGGVMVDDRGKRSGRGAYLCAQQICWNHPTTRRQLSAALRIPIDEETAAQLQSYAQELPERMETAHVSENPSAET